MSDLNLNSAFSPTCETVRDYRCEILSVNKYNYYICTIPDYNLTATK